MSDFHKLDHTHDELELLLLKIKEGYVFNEADYYKLINTIGLDNISTFSGSYLDLIDRPNINDLMDNEVKKAKAELEEEILKAEKQIKEIDDILKEKEQEFKELFTTKKYVENLITNLRTRINNINIDLLDKINNESVNVELKLDNKANINHTHAVSDITLLDQVLANKSSIGHTHATDHIHENQGILDAISEEKYHAWDSKANIDEVPVAVSQLLNDEDYVDLNFVVSYIANAIDELNIDSYLLEENLDHKLGVKTDVGHGHEPADIKDLHNLLDERVMKEPGKSLIDNDLIEAIKTLKTVLTKTTERPSNVIIGQYYFDAALGRPIWWNGTAWTDSTGRIV